MARQIIWMPEAIDDFQNVLLFLLSEWGLAVAERFEDEVNRRVFQLIEHVDIGKQSEIATNVRSIFITKHNRLYYRVSPTKIEILTIFSTHQDPASNPFE